MQHSQVDHIKFTLLTWQDLDVMTRDLAVQVLDSQRPYDRIIAVANGGLTMARHFGDLINLRKISLLQTAFYAGINETNREPTVLQPLAVDVSGERLIVFEDIVDTGTTLEFVLSLLRDQYGAKQVDSAALLQKSQSSCQPDFVVGVNDSWIIYPYETRETIVSLYQKWHQAGWSEDDILLALHEIGFQDSDISNFV